MSPQNNEDKDSPAKQKPQDAAKKSTTEREESKTSPVLWVSIGLGIFVVLVCLCAASIFGVSQLSDRFLGPRTTYPESELKVIQQKTESITVEGCEVELEDLRIVIPEDAVEGDGEILVAQVSPKSLPVEPPEEVIGDVFAIDWQSTRTSPDEEVSLNFQFNPKDIPDDIPLSQLSIFTFDGEDWIRMQSQIDQENHIITTTTSHFSWWSWGISRIKPDKTVADITVTGKVEFMAGDYQHDSHATSLPAAGLRFALVDSDKIILEEDWLKGDGSFHFVIPEGTDVGLGIDVILRVYADHREYGKVTKYAGLGAGAWYYNSEVYETSLSTESIAFGTIRIPEEASGAFNILHAIGQGHRFSSDEGFWTPSPVHVVWVGPSDDEPFDNGFNEEDIFISVASSPQSAWDHDLVRALYGEYLLYDLYGHESLFCNGRYDTVAVKTNPCWAWHKGWGLFFGTASGGDSLYEEFRNRSSAAVSLDLEDDFYTDTPETAASVATLLWDLADRSEDGERVSIPMDEIFQLLRNYGTQVDSIESFYNFWDIRVGIDASTCQVFADYEVVEAEECPRSSPAADSQYEDVEDDRDIDNQQGDDDYIWIEYGDNLYGELEPDGQNVYIFEGDAGDLIEIGMMAYEEDQLDTLVILIQEWDNRVVDQNDDMQDGMPDSLMENVELPEDGQYLILARGEGQGEYMLWLEFKGYASSDSQPEETKPPVEIEPTEESEPTDKPEPTEEPETTEESQPTEDAQEGEIIDLGVVPHYDAPKTWKVEIPSNFTRVEVACYGADNDQIMQYCGWYGSLSIDGEYVWKFARYDSELGGIFHNYLLGEDILEKDGKGLYLDVTDAIQAGEIEITFNHNTSGSGAGIKVRIVTEN